MNSKIGKGIALLVLVAVVGCSAAPDVPATADQAAVDSIGNDINDIQAEEIDFSDLDTLDQDLDTLI